jgi:hypothetical protein
VEIVVVKETKRGRGREKLLLGEEATYLLPLTDICT